MVTVKFYLKNSSKNGKLRTDEVSILAKITLNKRNRFEVRTGEKIEPKFWDKKNQQVKSTYRDHYDVNEVLLQFKSRILKLYRENQHLSFDRFKLLAQEKPNTEKKTLFLALDQFIEAYRSEKDSKTVAKYLTLQRHLILFDKQTPIDFQTLDFNFYDRFKAYLLAIPNPFYKNYRLLPSGDNDNCFVLHMGDHGDPVGIFDDNVFSYIIQLKTFLAWSEKRGRQVNKSYKTWQIIRRVHPPISLTSKELEQLENATYESKALETARDYLVFECRTGQRISDIKRFDLKDLHDDKWTFTPRKGNRLSSKTITVHFKGFCAPALDILHRYNWKMPVVSEQKINENIKKACKLADINQETVIYRWAANKRIKISGPKYEYISSHCGRKTFITLGLQSGIPVEYIMQLTGITEYKTINHYKAKFEDSMIEKYLTGIETKGVMRKVK